MFVEFLRPFHVRTPRFRKKNLLQHTISSYSDRTSQGYLQKQRTRGTTPKHLFALRFSSSLDPNQSKFRKTRFQYVTKRSERVINCQKWTQGSVTLQRAHELFYAYVVRLSSTLGEFRKDNYEDQWKNAEWRRSNRAQDVQ